MSKTKEKRKSISQPQPVRSAARRRSPGPKSIPSPGFPTISLEELAREQGIRPVKDLNELAMLWPGEFDPDEFLNWLSVERTARRQSVGDKETD